MLDHFFGELEVNFTPFRPGTIRDLFSPKRNAPTKAKVYDPLGLPSIKSQCVHVETEVGNDDDGYYRHVRCVEDAVLGRHGWLCAKHNTDVVVRREREYRDKDAEIVAGILAYEDRMLRNVERDVVRIGPKTQITYVR